MTNSTLPFIPGRTKYYLLGTKAYCAKLTRHGEIRYSKRVRATRTATEAQQYADRWAQRAAGFMKAAVAA